MKIFIERVQSSEFFATDLYESNNESILAEADVEEKWFNRYNKIQLEYWTIQGELEALVDAVKRHKQEN